MLERRGGGGASDRPVVAADRRGMSEGEKRPAQEGTDSDDEPIGKKLKVRESQPVLR